MKKKFKIGGFTLIELLLVVAVLAATGTIVVAILVTTLQTSKKSDLLVVMKQNGDSAMSQVVKGIRYAKTLNIPTVCYPSVSALDHIAVTGLDNTQTTFYCASSTITSNGISLLDTNNVTTTSCSFSCSQTTLNDPPTININFTLTAKKANSFVETRGTIPFNTSVTMRNFKN